MRKTIRRTRKFAHKIAQRAGLTPAQTRLTADIVQGISQRGSCHLSEMGRALGERVPLKVTEQRLSEGLARPSFCEEALAEAYLDVVAPAARRMRFVAVDPTELVKRYGRDFEHLDTVRDASDRRKHLEPGYWTVRIEATDYDNQTLPLCTEVFSTKAPDYAGWNETFEAAVRRVVPHVDRDAIWLFDRAFDGMKWMSICENVGLRWVIRQQQTRHIELADGSRHLMSELVSTLRCPYEQWVPYVNKKTHEMDLYRAEYGYAPVRVPKLEAPLYLIVVQRPNREPLALLTNVRVRSKTQAAELLLAYMRRWGAEDGIRFWKQKTGIEDLRVRNYHSIRCLALLAMVAHGMQALLLLTRPALARRIMKTVKAFIPEVPFMQYRLWDGIRNALLAEA